MPVSRPGVSPGDLASCSTLEVCVRDRQLILRTQLENPFTIAVHAPDTVMPDAVIPSSMVATNSGVEIAKKVDWFCARE